MRQRGSHVVLKKQKSEGEIERLDAMPFELESPQDHAKLGYLLLRRSNCSLIRHSWHDTTISHGIKGWVMRLLSISQCRSNNQDYEP